MKIVLGEDDAPNFSAIYKRINKIKLEENNGKSWFADGKTRTEIVFLAGDSTGLQPIEATGWETNGTYDVDSSKCMLWWIARPRKFMQCQ